MFRQWIAAGLAVLVGAGCWNSEVTDAVPARKRVNGIPVLDGATSPPGASLGDGFRVPPGTVLVGTPLPASDDNTYYGEPIIDEGWRAFLLLVGDPADALRSLSQQAESHGLVPIHSRCESSSNGLECAQVSSVRAEGSFRELRAVIARTSDDSREPRSYLILRYEDRPARSTDASPVPSRQSEPRGSGPVTLPVPPVPVRWPVPEFEEDQLDLRYGHYPALRIERGTDIASPPWPGNCSGLVWILDVRRDPSEVMRAYERQLASAFPVDPVAVPQRAVRVRHDGNAEILELDGGNEDLMISLQLVTRPSQPPWLFIETCPTT